MFCVNLELELANFAGSLVPDQRIPNTGHLVGHKVVSSVAVTVRRHRNLLYLSPKVIKEDCMRSRALIMHHTHHDCILLHENLVMYF